MIKASFLGKNEQPLASSCVLVRRQKYSTWPEGGKRREQGEGNGNEAEGWKGGMSFVSYLYLILLISSQTFEVIVALKKFWI